MVTAIKHPVPDRVKQSFVFLTSGHSDAQHWASECPGVKNYKRLINPVWHRMLYSCTHMATVGVKGLMAGDHSTVAQSLLLLLMMMMVNHVTRRMNCSCHTGPVCGHLTMWRWSYQPLTVDYQLCL